MDFLKRFDGGERPEPPPARATFAALGRADYRVHVVEVEPWQFAFLKACEAPAPLYAAVRAAALGVGVEPSRVLAASALWLPAAFDLGLLRRVG